VERIKITPSEFWVKDTVGNLVFNSNFNYLKPSSTGDFKVGGIPATPMVEMVDNTPATSNTGYPAKVVISGDSYTITLPPCDSMFSSNSLDNYYSVLPSAPDAILPVSDAHTIGEIQNLVLSTPFTVSLNGVNVGDLKIEYIEARVTDEFDQYGTSGHRYSLPSITLTDTATNIITFDLPHKGTSYSYTWERTYSFNVYNYGYTPPVGETGSNTGAVWWGVATDLLSPFWCCSKSANTLTLEVV